MNYYKIIRKNTGEILSTGLTDFEVKYLLVVKGWPANELTITKIKTLKNKSHDNF